MMINPPRSKTSFLFALQTEDVAVPARTTIFCTADMRHGTFVDSVELRKPSLIQ